MSEFRPLSMYAVKNDSNIIADITCYFDNNIIYHETIVKSKKAFENQHPSIISKNVFTLDEI